MSAEEKRDLRFAVMVLCVLAIVMLGIGVWVGRATACESFEDCMKAKSSQSEIIRYDGTHVIDGRTYYGDSGSLRAIAFKLDEISKKLEPKPSEPTSPTDIIAQAITRNRTAKNKDSVGI